MKYIASLSCGKDSIAMLEVIKQHNLPLDRILHVEIMATPNINADLPPMVEFKEKFRWKQLEKTPIEEIIGEQE